LYSSFNARNKKRNEALLLKPQDAYQAVDLLCGIDWPDSKMISRLVFELREV